MFESGHLETFLVVLATINQAETSPVGDLAKGCIEGRKLGLSL